MYCIYMYMYGVTKPDWQVDESSNKVAKYSAINV